MIDIRKKELIIEQLGTLLETSARASVAKGVQYDPSTNPTESWRQVADTVAKLIKVMIQENRKLENE